MIQGDRMPLYAVSNQNAKILALLYDFKSKQITKKGPLKREAAGGEIPAFFLA
jgi:hypothetical protein